MANKNENTEAEVAAAEAKAKADNDAKAKAAEAKAKADAAAEELKSLTKVHKNGESLHVHPTTVDAHVAAGWTIS